MLSPLLNLQAGTIAMKSPMPAVDCDIYAPGFDENGTQFRSLYMKWIVVTDTTGNRRLQMRWRTH